MPPTPNRIRRIKSTDNALTLPGRTFFPKGTYIRTPFTPAAGIQANGLSGPQGAPFAMAPGLNTTGFNLPSYNPATLAQRGRGYNSNYQPSASYQAGFNPSATNLATLAQRGRSALSSAYGTDDSWYRPTVQPSAATTPPTAPGMVETSIGTGSEEFMNTKFMQKNIENNTPFEKQLRWDPDRNKYVQFGKLIKEGRLNVKTGRLSRKKRGRDEAPAAAPVAMPAPVVQQPVQQVVPQPSIANAFVSFRA